MCFASTISYLLLSFNSILIGRSISTSSIPSFSSYTSYLSDSSSSYTYVLSLDSLWSSVCRVIANSLSLLSGSLKVTRGRSLMLRVLLANDIELDLKCFLAVDDTLFVVGLDIVVNDFLFDWHTDGLCLSDDYILYYADEGAYFNVKLSFDLSLIALWHLY